ncbi:MAG: hypothetical protein HQL99_02100 [Magnetococcales bacterium]|nr:hypothetical protein [Magnetococcales bacterium]
MGLIGTPKAKEKAWEREGQGGRMTIFPRLVSLKTGSQARADKKTA